MSHVSGRRRSVLRVLHCPNMVGGHPGALVQAERDLGLRSWAVSFEPVHRGYTADEVLFSSRPGRAVRELRRWRFLGRALRSFDVVHFNFGSSILPRAYPAGLGADDDRSPLRQAFRIYARGVELRDVRWLRRAGKTIAVTYQGDDARQADVCRRRFDISAAHEVEPTQPERALDRRKRAWIDVFGRLAHRVYALNPDLLHVLPARAEFLPYGHVDLRRWAPTGRRDEARVPRLIHAPTDPVVKGTKYVLGAVEQLRAEGVRFEFELLEGLRPQDEARGSYERADLLVDQLLVGWYGSLALELMALGKPVVCYLREGDLAFLPPQMRAELPIIRANPESVYSVLKEWLTAEPARLREVGERSRAYVQRWHDPRRIAARLKADYEAAFNAQQ
jgi:glycosyltransferase involved in cell wall biosynthesis